MNKIQRFVIWICKKFNRDEILNIIDELVIILNDKNPDILPEDDFAAKHPNYRDFSVDPLAPINAAEINNQKTELNFQSLLDDYKKLHGKDLKPIKLRNNSNSLSNLVQCPYCSAPHNYIYFNDGKKKSQLKCKVCSNTFQLKKRFFRKTKYYCPYCSKALFTWKENKEVTIYKCCNHKCAYRIDKLNNLNENEIKLREKKTSQFKINYQYREYHFPIAELNTVKPDKPKVNLNLIHNDINILSLILTLHISYAITARKTAHMLKNIWNIKVSYQTVLNYCNAAAYYCHKFNLKLNKDFDDIVAGDETYIKVKGKWNYVWLFISSFRKIILAYHLSDNRGVKPAISAMLQVLKSAKNKQNITFVTDGNPSYQAGIHFINANKPEIKIDLRKVIGLQNLDSESEEYRAFKQIIERLIRTFKYHSQSQNGFGSINGAISKLVLFVTHYNFLREHSALNYKPPIKLPELSDIPLLQNKWSRIISLAA